ncbi:hypothetical protein bAD24_p00620 (plasmid) [Burkholderia sp. AD24]|nr:hypothetical protein bAD24_p00620 [Burkholderia sp. AD24]
MNATTYGLDVAKRVFQMNWVDAQTGEIANRQFGRDEYIGFSTMNRPGAVHRERMVHRRSWTPPIPSGSWR